MGLPEGVNRRWASVCALVLLVIWLWVAFDRPYSFPNHVPWNADANASEAPDEKVVGSVENQTMSSQAIRNMCGGTAWNASLVFMCDNSAGDVGNVRNSILACVRYAIAAGANLVLPRIVNPEGEHQAGAVVLDWDRQPFDYMFDKEHFLNSMAKSCPDMTVYGEKDDIPWPDNYVRPPVITIIPETIGQQQGEDWRTSLYKIVDAMISPTEDTFPVIIEMVMPKPLYDVYSDGKQFAYDFGDLLKFRPDVRALANIAILKLEQRAQKEFDITQQILPDAFFGAHLYTEQSKVGMDRGWPELELDYARYEPQAENILSSAAATTSSNIYLASQRYDEMPQFTKDAEAKNFTVHTKFSLLDGQEKEILNHLQRDQQVLVDYLVLLKASYFAGIGHSSVDWNVALKRHTWVDEGKPVTLGSHVFEDELSHLYGKPDEGRGLYPNIWP